MLADAILWIVAFCQAHWLLIVLVPSCMLAALAISAIIRPRLNPLVDKALMLWMLLLFLVVAGRMAFGIANTSLAALWKEHHPYPGPTGSWYAMMVDGQPEMAVLEAEARAYNARARKEALGWWLEEYLPGIEEASARERRMRAYRPPEGYRLSRDEDGYWWSLTIVPGAKEGPFPDAVTAISEAWNHHYTREEPL